MNNLNDGMDTFDNSNQEEKKIEKKPNANSTFVSPYNFVTLDPKGKTLSEDYSGETYTGYIDISIEVKTPLIIPNTTNENFYNCESDHKSYGYYSYEDLKDKNKQTLAPIIPGSELRGAIRSVHEALNNSCMSSIGLDKIFTRRALPEECSEKIEGETIEYIKRGFIIKGEEGKWDLFSLANKPVNILTRFKETFKNKNNTFGKNSFDIKKRKLYFDGVVYENLDDFCYNTEKDKINGTLVIGEPNKENPNLNNFRIEVWSKGEFLHHVSEDDINKLIYVLKQYRNPKINSLLKDKNKNSKINPVLNEKDNQSPYEKYGELEGNIYPIFYKEEFGHVYLSPAQLGRYALYSRVRDKIYNYAPCNKKEICKTCKLFGMVDNLDSLGSRVRFTDCKAKNFEKMDKITLPILATPNYSNVDFYGMNGEENPKGKVIFDAENVVIRGRKFYWHHYPDLNSSKETEMNCTVTPIKEGSVFEGKVYFEDVYIEEIEGLLEAITLCDDNHCQKIGKGKPLGFGSVNIKASKINYRKIKIENSRINYKEESENIKYIKEGISFSLDEKEYLIKKIDDRESVQSQELANLTNFEFTKNLTVHYPYTYKLDEEGYKWFSDNNYKKAHLKLPFARNKKEIELTTNPKNSGEK